jgi:hydroxymethylpyrimidine/phosphomethylpyrimidine kinase
MRRHLLPLADLVTPNLPEAATLIESPVAKSENEAVVQGRKLLALGARAVLIKGGHAEGTESVDHLMSADGTLRRFASARVDTRNTHGTGCTLSSAVAAGLARGLSLTEAVTQAKRYVTAAIAASNSVTVGRGHGPVHHFHALWH